MLMLDLWYINEIIMLQCRARGIVVTVSNRVDVPIQSMKRARIHTVSSNNYVALAIYPKHALRIHAFKNIFRNHVSVLRLSLFENELVSRTHFV